MGSLCLQSGHQLHCQRHRSGLCTWLPDKTNMEERKGERGFDWSPEVMLYDELFWRIIVPSKYTTIVYTPLHTANPCELTF